MQREKIELQTLSIGELALVDFSKPGALCVKLTPEQQDQLASSALFMERYGHRPFYGQHKLKVGFLYIWIRESAIHCYFRLANHKPTPVDQRKHMTYVYLATPANGANFLQQLPQSCTAKVSS